MPVLLLVVGDLAGVAESVPTDSLKRRLYQLYVHLEERLLQAMVDRALTIKRPGVVREARPTRATNFETRNSTIHSAGCRPPRLHYKPPAARLCA